MVGYYRGKDLVYVARVRNGFVPASRRQVFEKIRDLVSPIVPFANLPDTHKSRWGDELTAEKMKECVWLRPEAVAQIEFLEWIGSGIRSLPGCGRTRTRRVWSRKRGRSHVAECAIQGSAAIVLLLTSFVVVFPGAHLSTAAGNPFLGQSGREDGSPYGDKEKYEHSKWHVHW